MRKKAILFLLVVSLVFSILIPIKSNAQIKKIAANAIVGTVIVHYNNLIENTIEKAENTGDYLLFKTATELKNLLDSWEEANSNLIKKAFNELNKSQKQFFAEVDVAAKKISGSAEEQLEGATRITELANQTVSDVNVFDNKFAVFRYAPRVVYPGIAQDLYLKIRGINFDKAEPSLILPNGQKAEREFLLRQEAVFKVPSSIFQYDRKKTTIAKLKLEYLDLGKRNLLDIIRRNRNKASADIAIMQLPQNLGNYSLVTQAKKIKTSSRSISKKFSLSGRNKSRIFIQNPHANKWKIKVETIARISSWGEAGKECSLNSKNPYGFTIKIRTGIIRKLFNPNGSGYQHCIWTWKEFKEVPFTETKLSNGTISWNKDISLNLPDKLESYKLTIGSFEGKEKTITTSEVHSFYEVKQNNKSLVIRAKIPKDLNIL